MAAEALALLHLRATELVLDVGGEDGKVTSQMAERLGDGSVVGLDASPPLIEFASSHFSRSSVPLLGQPAAGL